MSSSTNLTGKKADAPAEPVGIPITLDNAAAAAVALRDSRVAKSLAEAVCKVMREVGYVQKDKQMTGGGSYRYVSVEAVIDALRPAMIREQLVLLPTAVEPLHQGDHGRQVHLRVRYTFTLTHAPTGQSSPVAVIGEGMDVGDKAGNKAMTAARKYALIMAFNIETGLDPDDTPSQSQERAAAPAATPPQRPADPRADAVRREIRRTGRTWAGCVEWLNATYKTAHPADVKFTALPDAAVNALTKYLAGLPAAGPKPQPAGA